VGRRGPRWVLAMGLLEGDRGEGPGEGREGVEEEREGGVA